jgi:hypothetical protein
MRNLFVWATILRVSARFRLRRNKMQFATDYTDDTDDTDEYIKFKISSFPDLISEF